MISRFLKEMLAPQQYPYLQYKDIFLLLGLCTFTKTGLTYPQQEWYQCRTCSFEEDQVVCPVCIESCHFNHDVVYFGITAGYCDCGAEVVGPCRALKKRQSGNFRDLFNFTNATVIFFLKLFHFFSDSIFACFFIFVPVLSKI